MEVLPSTSSLVTTQVGVNSSQTSCSAAFQLRGSSESFNNLRGKHRPRVSSFTNRFNPTPVSRDEFHFARKPISSTVVTLSPIAASPLCSPQPAFHNERPSESQIAALAVRLSVDQPRVLKVPQVLPPTVSASASFSFLTLPSTPQAITNPQDIEKSVEAMTQKRRSFSESSLELRHVLEYGSENSDTTAAAFADVATISPQRKADFHIPCCSNIEDDKDRIERTYNEWPHNDCKDSKDRIRRFHALKELLTTECGYLNDLRALVTVYLRSLSTMSNHGPHSLSGLGILNTNSHGKDFSKPALPGAFSEDELVILRRNAEKVLKFHERFLHELKLIMEPFGININTEQDNDCPNDTISTDLDEAIQKAAQQFVKEAPSFHIYQDFCCAHLEALEIIRTKQHQHPIEWDTFEHHCALVLSARARVTSELTSSGGSPEELTQTLSVKKRKRTASLATLDEAFRSLRLLASREQVPLQLCRNDNYSSRLTFLDYMIKPVQRICKYPLLLAQLQQRGSLQEINPSVHAIIESSVKAMKDVVVAVDEAHHKKDKELKSSLIVSRILFSAASGYPHHLSDVFLSSLGTCLLAGSLDMIHHSLTKSKNDFSHMKAKYLGAFLYPGGYLILVRVKGKIYEPRHWFPLANFDLRDITEDIALLSSSFCLYSDNDVFELAAACPKGKDIWLKSIRDSLECPQIWDYEPVSSLDIQNHWKLGSEQKLSRDGLGFTQINPPLRSEPSNPPAHRTSSFVSLKAMFAQGRDSDAFIVHRPSTSMRQQADLGLRDVISQACFGAGIYNAGEELFQVPTAAEPFVRSSSSISMMSLAKTGLSKHDSVKISRRNSLPSGTGTSTRRELLEARSIVLRARNCANRVMDCKQKPPPLPESEDLKLDSLEYHTADNAESFTRVLLCTLKGFFQSHLASDLDLGAASHYPPAERHCSLLRAKITGNVFRRLSMKSPLYHGMLKVPSNTSTGGAAADQPEGVSAMSGKDIPIRRRTVSRWPPTLDNVERASV